MILDAELERIHEEIASRVRSRRLAISFFLMLHEAHPMTHRLLMVELDEHPLGRVRCYIAPHRSSIPEDSPGLLMWLEATGFPRWGVLPPVAVFGQARPDGGWQALDGA